MSTPVDDGSSAISSGIIDETSAVDSPAGSHHGQTETAATTGDTNVTRS